MADYSDQIKAQALAYLLAGQTPSEVARAFGIPVGTLVPIINDLCAFAEIAINTKRLEIFDTATPAFTDRNDMLRSKHFRLAAAHAHIAESITQRIPLFLRVAAAILLYSRQASTSIFQCFIVMSLAPLAVSLYVVGVSCPQARIRTEPFLILILVLFAEGFIIRVSITPARALAFPLFGRHLRDSITVVSAYTCLTAYRVSVGLFLIAAEFVKRLGFATPRALSHVWPHIVSYGFIIP